MPEILREDGFKVVIYSLDHNPPHVHVHKAGCSIRVWLDPQALDFDRNVGFSPKGIAKVLALVEKNRESLLKHWRKIHG